jgi:hypothetical protein
MLADMAMKVEAARLMVYSAAARAERGETNLGFISAASKYFASDVAMELAAPKPWRRWHHCARLNRRAPACRQLPRQRPGELREQEAHRWPGGRRG